MTTTEERTMVTQGAVAPERQEVLRRALVELKAARAEVAAAKQARDEPVAVVGVGCRFPGGVTGAEGFWEFLARGGSGITGIPEDRWDVEEFFDEEAGAPGRMYVRHGGFLDGVRGFDAGLFGIPPREAAGIDPQHRLVLEVAWEALEHAGVAPDSLRGSRTGVFVGMGSNDFQRLGAGDVSLIDAYSATGSSGNFGANRLSYVLGLEGPSMVVDTACSSSLVALHLAVQSLRAGECGTALAGGVNVMLSPDSSVALSSGRMLSAQGLCRTFDASADGYVRGEGAGVVVLKRLSDALAAGDDILAVVRGSAVNQDGKSSGLTVPRASSQQEVVRRALAVAGIAAAEVGFVEAHGTGTPLGDPIEVRALGRVLGEGRAPDSPVALGSVKTNIGHLEAAAGIAGFIKAVLTVQRGWIPPHLNLVEPNPHVAWADLPVSVPTELTRWQQERRIAGVSAFGFGGTNAHVVLESPPVRETAAEPAPDGPVVVKVSGSGAVALRASAARLAEFTATADAFTPADLAWSAGVGRADLSDRAAVVVETSADLAEGLRAVAEGADAPGVVTGRRGAGPVPQAAFVATDGGARADGLYGKLPVVTATVDAVAAALGVPGEELAAGDGPAARYAATVALGAWWRSVGVEPDVIVGQGAGAYAAAALAGVFSIADGARLALAGRSADLADVRLRIPAVDLVLDHRTGPAGPEVATAEYWNRSADSAPDRPAALDAAPAAVLDSGVGIILELGTGALAVGGGDQDVLRLAPAADGPSAHRVLLESLAQVWARGREVDWSAVVTRPASPAKLPTYPFQRQEYWPRNTSAGTATASRSGRALRPHILETADGEVIGESELSLAALPFLAEHRVHGRLVVPGVVYLELVLRCAERAFDGPVGIEDLTISRPLVLSDQDTRTVQVVLGPLTDGKTEVRVHSKDPVAGWQQHLRALVVPAAPAGGDPAEVTPAALFEDAGTRCQDTLDGADFYRRAWHPAFRLGPSFQLVESARRGPGVAVGRLVPPDARTRGVAAGVRADLLLLDACVQLVAIAGHPQPADWAERPVHLGTGYERMVVHGAVAADEVLCTVVTRATADGSLAGDLRLTAPDGSLVAELSGVSFRPVSEAMLERMVSSGRPEGAAGAGGPVDLAALRAAEPAERERTVTGHLVRLLAAVLGSAPEEVDPGTEVTAVADSLMLAELKSQVDRDFEVGLPLEIVFTGGRLTDLAEWVAGELEQSPAPAPAGEEPSPGSAPAASAVAPAAPASASAAASAAAAPAAPRAAARPRGLGSRRVRSMTVADMVEKAELEASITATVPPEPAGTAPQDVLLTGATGFVGAFLLAELLERRPGTVHCLVRADDEQHALRRVLANLTTYGVDVGDAAARIVPVVGDLSKSRFGLGAEEFTGLHARIGDIFHCGATVKWTYPYSGLEAANVDGTREVLRLATAGAARPVHFISTVGVFSSKEFEADSVPESQDLLTSGPLVVGYAQSKWVAEHMVRTAHGRGVPVTIHRINSGPHSSSGAFNRLDHLSMVIKGCAEAGIAPDHVEMPLQPAPIDYVARAVVELAGRPELSGRTFHLVNDTKLTWIEFFDLVEEYGYPMERMTFARWKEKVTGREAGTMALLGLVPFLNDAVDDVRLPKSAAEDTRAALEGTGISCPPLDAALVRTYLESFTASGFMEGPAAG
ncbi:thioester reductase domain-containing protein [Kitasatospora sp. NPDC004723]|uniref:thioester reductase domain-containing protein n=1 Tax=Kitasatospora sp. NPDC004723 TaxID=3154288 RepID=UPI0033AA04FC